MGLFRYFQLTAHDYRTARIHKTGLCVNPWPTWLIYFCLGSFSGLKLKRSTNIYLWCIYTSVGGWVILLILIVLLLLMVHSDISHSAINNRFRGLHRILSMIWSLHDFQETYPSNRRDKVNEFNCNDGCVMRSGWLVDSILSNVLDDFIRHNWI